MNRDQRVIWDLTGEVQRLHELLLDARDMIRAGIDDYDGVQEDALVGRIEAALAGAAVQPERCCLDYPRCDCNSPPEPDNAPTLQPCGHPWKAQHNFKCILCSSPR